MSTQVSLNAISSNFNLPNQISTYVSYQFTTPALLEVDSSANNIALTNNGGSYAFDTNRNSLLLQTTDTATFPSVNWSTYNDLAISCWLKTTSFANNDVIFNFETLSTEVTFYYNITDMLAWHRFEGNLANYKGLDFSLTPTPGTSFTTTPYDSTNKQEGEAALNSANVGSGFLASNSTTPTVYTVNSISFTIAFWVRITDFINGNQAIFCIGTGTANNSIVFGGFASASSFVFTFGGNNLTCNAGSSNFVANTWYHIACVFNNINKLRYIYVNGVLVTNDTVEQTAPTHTTTLGYFRIGKPVQNISSVPYNSFKGQLDDFRIYNRVLTNREIINLYTMATKGNLKMQLLNSGKLTFIQDGWNAYQANTNPLNNTWTHVLWIIKSSAYSNSVIRFNNNIGTQITYEFLAPYLGTYTNTLGSAANSASSSLYISDFRILTIPLTNAIEAELYNPTSTIYTKIFTSDFFDNALNYINNRKQNNLTAGTGISISNNTVSTNLAAGTGISISGNTVSTNLAAGTGISISGNTISASDSFKAHFVVNNDNGELITSTTSYQFYGNTAGRFNTTPTTPTTFTAGTSFSYNVYNVNLTNIGISLHTNQNIKVGKFRIFARFTSNVGAFFHQTHDIIIHLDSSNNLIHMETFNVDYSSDSTQQISSVCGTVSNSHWYSLGVWSNTSTTFPMRIKYNSLTNVDIMFNSHVAANNASAKLYKLIIYL
jgi:hypothetical protein